MRALVTIAVIGLLAAAVSAQTCSVAEPTTLDPFEPSACSAYVACDVTFCGCVGAKSNTNNATACLASAPTTTNCSTVQTCVLAYTKCLLQTEANRTSSIAACNSTGTKMHNAVLAAAATTYAGSFLQQSCRFRVCEVLHSFRTTCSFGTNDSSVCQAPSATLAPSVVYAIRATLRLSGTAYDKLLNNATARAMLETALQNDLGTLLGINPAFIRILSLTLGSLIVDFAILNGSGKSVSQLTTGLAAATANTNWLSSTKAIYSTVSNETIGVLSLTVTEAGGSPVAPNTTTAASSTTTGAPLPSSAMGTSAVAAAALALVALML